MKIADVIRSQAGHDKGKVFMVLCAEGEYVTLADGRSRRVEKPKRKKRMHTQKIASHEGTTADKLHRGEPVSNKELWEALRLYREG